MSPGNLGNALAAVAGAGGSDVWAVGTTLQSAPGGTYTRHTLIEHFTG
jgi:hypothetical protein